MKKYIDNLFISEIKKWDRNEKARKILALPFQIIGITMFGLVEIISGEKVCWRNKEYNAIVMAVCSKCGHKDYLNKVIKLDWLED